MKKFLFLILCGAAPLMAEFRAGEYYYRGEMALPPEPVGVLIKPGASWVPMTTGGGTGALSYVPPVSNMYVCPDGSGNNGCWVPWTGVTSGDATTINGGTVPASAAVLGTNSSRQPIAATAAQVSGLLGGGSTFTGLRYANGSSADTAVTQAQFNNVLGGGTTFTGLRKANGTTQDTQATACTDYAGLACTNIFTVNGAASTPAITFNGLPYTSGSSTTSKPQVLIEPSGTTSTNWNSQGTMLGINAASGFTGDLIRFELNTAIAFGVTSAGNATLSGSLNSSSAPNGQILMGTSSAPIVLSRNVNDAHPALRVLNSNASSTGPIICFQNSGQSGDTCAASVSTAGVVSSPQYLPTGSAPTMAAGAAAGTTPTCTSITGTNMAGVITCTTGTSTTTGTLATITFNGTLGTAPQGCRLQPRDATTAPTATSTYTTAPSTTAWTIGVATALTASTTYVWSYGCI